ncbi:MAG: hypothetical protein KJ051_09690 [Thermoleophilia bacterium]|nr:hypothetical protein [Thermoleophilia bacterium]
MTGGGAGGGGGGQPPAPPGEPPGPPGEPQDAARLDRDFAEWARALSDEERSTIRRYQRHGARINDFLRGGEAPLPPDLEDEIDVLIERLDGLVARGRLGRHVTVWRGLDTDPFVRLEGSPIEASFSSTSLNRELVAARYPIVLEIVLPPGTPAAWLALVSAPALRRELEILLPRGVSYSLHDVREEDRAIFVKAEVIA